MKQVIEYIDRTEYQGILLDDQRYYTGVEILNDNRIPIELEVYDDEGELVLDKNIIESIDEYINRYAAAFMG